VSGGCAVTSENVVSNASFFREHGAMEIEYWQGGFQLVAFGMREASRSLPQDEATAAVMLGALLARNFADDAWPGVYQAVVRDERTTVTVAEDDLRVAAVRELLRGCRELSNGQQIRRDFTAEEFDQARTLALTIGPDPTIGSSSPTDGGGR
jgi:hypothetical protein